MIAQYYDSYQNSSGSDEFAVWVVIALVCGIIGAVVGSPKGRPWQGFLLGLGLGPIGLLIIVFAQPSESVREKRLAEQAQMIARAQASVPQPPTPPATPPPAGPPMRPCPFCAELIQPAAIVCRFCRNDVPPVSPPT